MHEHITAVAADLVEAEFSPCCYRHVEVAEHRLRVGQICKSILEVGRVGHEALINLSRRPLKERLACGFVGSQLAGFEYDTAVVCVPHFHTLPQPHSLGMRRPLRPRLNFNGAGIVLVEYVLNGVEVMLTHVRKTAAVIVPVAAESPVGAMRMIRFVRGRAQPHIVIEMPGYTLWF